MTRAIHCCGHESDCYSSDLGHSPFVISKQDVGDLNEITLPSDTQLDYYNKKIVEFIQDKLSCHKEHRFF